MKGENMNDSNIKLDIQPPDEIKPRDMLGKREDGTWEKIQAGKEYIEIGEAISSPIIDSDGCHIELIRR